MGFFEMWHRLNSLCIQSTHDWIALSVSVLLQELIHFCDKQESPTSGLAMSWEVRVAHEMCVDNTLQKEGKQIYVTLICPEPTQTIEGLSLSSFS